MFLLEEHHEDLQQLLSLFEPLTSVNFRSQAEEANQVEVLLLLFKARETVLNRNATFFDYRHSKDPQTNALTSWACRYHDLNPTF